MKVLALLSSISLSAAFSFQTTVVPYPHHQVTTRPLARVTTTLNQALSDDDTPNSNRISIEYCTGCRWMLKSFWMAQELLTTFEDRIDAVTVIPSDSKGIYAVRLNGDNLLWDRKEQGAFPSPKALKQIVRDLVEPEKFLGHSDTDERQQTAKDDTVDEKDTVAREDSEASITFGETEAPLPSITITYCTGCRWLLRAAYFGQELLTTFSTEIKSVSLVPSKPPAKGGRFSIHLNGEMVFDRAIEGRFPEVKELKQIIRDKISPEKDLGHSDVQEVPDSIQEQTDDELEEQRRFFGVD